MNSLLGKRWLWLLLGLILLSAVIWIGGPYLSFADYPPLAPALARVPSRAAGSRRRRDTVPRSR